MTEHLTGHHHPRRGKEKGCSQHDGWAAWGSRDAAPSSAAEQQWRTVNGLYTQAQEEMKTSKRRLQSNTAPEYIQQLPLAYAVNKCGG